MGLFDKKPKVKTNTVLFVQKRVEMSALYSTYIEYLNDTEEHNKGDFEIYHYETTDRKGNPYITVRYNAKDKTGMILFNDQFEVETKEMSVIKGEYSLVLTEPDITIHRFGAKRINAKGMIRYISVLNSINKTKIKPSLFYDVNNLEEFEKPLEFTFVTLNPNQRAGDVFGEGITSSGDKYTYSNGFAHLASGLCCGISSWAAGIAIGIAGDAGARGLGQQDKLFVGMMLILIFAEALGLYGLIVSLILIS